MPWIGPEISVGLLEEGGKPVGVMTISVRDSGAAKVFLEDWIDYLEDEEGLDFDSDEEDGVLIWIDEIDGLAFALADKVLLTVASEEPEEQLDDLLELVAGEEDRTLAAEEAFQAARAQLSGRRFASVFLNVEDSIDALESSSLLGSDFDEVRSAAEAADIPDWVAVSAQWIDRGIVVEALAPNTEAYAQNVADLDDPAELVPSETIGLLAATFDPDLDNWRGQLEKYGSNDDELSYAIDDIYEEMYWEVERESDRPPRRKENPDVADVLALALELVDAYTGVDLERDLMDHLGGTLVVSVEEFDLVRIQEDPEEETVNAAVMLSYRSEGEETLVDTLEDLADLLQDQVEVDIDSVDVGADNDAEIFRPDFFGIETDYAPGYVFHDGYLIFGTTEEALENTVGAQTGNLDDLSSHEEYRRAVGELPGNRQFLFWMSLERIVSQVDPDDTDMTDEEFEVLQASAGSIAASASADAEHIRLGMAFTFFPE